MPAGKKQADSNETTAFRSNDRNRLHEFGNTFSPTAPERGRRRMRLWRQPACRLMITYPKTGYNLSKQPAVLAVWPPINFRLSNLPGALPKKSGNRFSE
jgi:hypothetical protein